MNINFPSGLPVLLFLIFLTLKLCHEIDWSWWWVTCPLWVPLAIAFPVVAVVLILAIVSGVLKLIVK